MRSSTAMPVRAGSLIATGAAALTVALATAGPAAAHVTANPRTAEQGSYTKVSFRVPNEEQNADTTRLEIGLPADHPIASVSVRPVPGWKATVTRAKLPKPITSGDRQITEAVTKIVWEKGTIAPGQFQEFDVSMGPLPTDTDTLAFPAVQTYSGGKVVRWDQPTAPGGAEPEHPAPTLRLTKPTGTSHGMGAAHTTSSDSHSDAHADPRPADDGTARLVGTLGLATGVVGIGVGGAALATGRRRRS